MLTIADAVELGFTIISTQKNHLTQKVIKTMLMKGDYTIKISSKAVTIGHRACPAVLIYHGSDYNQEDLIHFLKGVKKWS